MLFAAGIVGILVATVVRFFAYRFLVFNQELDQEPEFSHDHELIEHHHAAKPAARQAEPAAEDPEVPARRE
jgi:predicted cobalt transporter CbtA